MSRARKRSRAFTLVEVLVTLAIAGIFLGLLYQFLIAQQRAYNVQDELADAQQNARVAVDELTRALTSLGAGARTDAGQPRLLVAHEYEIAFVADRDPAATALPPGATVPGADPADPFPVMPPGTYNTTDPAETYRYRLVQRTGEAFYTLYREVNGGADQQVAFLLANPTAGTPLFRYEGDFDGDGSYEWLDRADTTTSPRLAGGEPLDAVVRRIEVTVVAETASADPRYPRFGGHRRIVLSTAITPRNLWDCPIVTPSTTALTLRAPDQRGLTTPLVFRVTRGGIPEPGRTVNLSVAGPAGHGADVFDLGGGRNWVADADGYVTAVLTWPADCTGVPLGTYTVTAQTAEPPSLSFPPMGACAPHASETVVELVPGLPDAAVFGATAAPPPEPAPPPSAWPPPPLYEVDSCGESVTIGYRVLDACRNTVLPDDAAAHPLGVRVGTTEFGTLDVTDLDQPTGSVTYTSRTRGDYGSNFSALRSAADPDRFDTRVEAVPAGQQADIQVFLQPDALVPPAAWTIASAPYTDCPGGGPGRLPAADVFGVADRCGNAMQSLARRGTPVEAVLEPQAVGAAAPPDQGALSSPNNPSPDPLRVPVLEHNGTPGAFELRYQPPTCTVGGLSYAPTITLTPGWGTAGPAAVLTPTVEPCATCSTQVLNAAGAPTTLLDQVCDAESRVVVTQCVPTGTTALLTIVGVSGTGLPSFDRNFSQATLQATFPGGAPGSSQNLSVPLFIGSAQSGDAFRIEVQIPDPATVPAGTAGVTCQSDTISVDSRCSEILISPVPDNPGAVPTHPPAQDTPLCAADGNEVYFRVRDCDQNRTAYASDDIKNTAGTGRGLLVEVREGSPSGPVLDQESPNLYEVTIHGTRSVDSPYFQGSLPITTDLNDGDFSGALRVGRDRVLYLTARYTDPDDLSDRLCVAEALLVPPIPVCLPGPALSFGDWDGDLVVRGGDAVVAGNLLLPAPPTLLAKDFGAALRATGALDRFFNAYVGGEIRVGGTPLTPAGTVDRPFLPGGAGALYGTTQGNYFQAVPDTASLLARLDYDRLKNLARARKAYWYTEAGGTLYNPATLQRGTFEEVTALPGPGTASATHDGAFIFVDALDGFRSAGLVDGADLADLPVHTVRGPYYTEGLIYVAGSVDLAPAGGQKTVPVEAGAVADARYDENTAAFGREDLPVDFLPGTGPVSAGTESVNVRGALYADGGVTLSGAVRVYGSVVAERGVQAAAGAEIRYDPRWMESRLSLCSLCCGLSLSPVAPQVALGTDPIQLTAHRPQGAVVWSSLAPQVATVDDTGLVTPVAVGTAIIRAVDDTGCVAEAEVEVYCGLELAVSPGTSLHPLEQAVVSATGTAPPGSGVAWAVDNPSTLQLVSVLGGVTATVEADGIGGARLTATDPVGCSADVDFTVNCPAGRALVVSDTAPAPGDTVTLRVQEGADDVSGQYAFYADGTALGGQDYTVADLAPVSFTARLVNDQCTLGPVTATPACPAYGLTGDASTVPEGTPVVYTVRAPDGTDVTGDFSLRVEPVGAPAVVSGNTVTPTAPGTLSVVAEDGYGCPAGPAGLTATCAAYQVVATPAAVAVGDPIACSVLDPSGADATAAFTFAVDPPGSATVAGNTVTPTVPGTLRVGATNTDGCSAATATVNVSGCPAYTLSPPGATVTVGTPVTFTVTDSGGADVTASIAFSVDGVPIPGSTVTPTATGVQTVSAQDGAGCPAGTATIMALPASP